MLFRLTAAFLLLLFSSVAVLHAQTNRKRQTTRNTTSKNVSPPLADEELDRHRAAASSYQLAGDLDGANTENRAIISIALQRLGLVQMQQAKFSEASENLATSILISDNSFTRATLASAYLNLGRSEDALIQAQQAVDLDPRNVSAHQILGSIYYAKADYQSALPQLEDVVKSEPSFDAAYLLAVTYLRLKQLERAKLLLEEIELALKGQNAAQLHILFGQAYEQTGYALESEAEFKQAVAIDPKLRKAHFYMGFVILEFGGSGRLAEAGRAFQEELKLDPNDFYSNYFAGVVASSEGEHKEAVVFLKRAVLSNPKSTDAYLFLGQSQNELGDLVAAEKSLRTAIGLEGVDKSGDSRQNRRAHFLLGRLLLKTNRREEGVKELAKARELQDELLDTAKIEIGKILNSDAGLRKAVIGTDKIESGASSVKDPAAAKTSDPAYLQRVEWLSGILGEAYHNLGVISAQRGDIADSIAMFKNAYKWKPDLPALSRNLGIVYFRSNQFEMAVQPLARQLTLDPKDDLVRRMLGLSYYFTKDYKNSVATLKPIEMQPAFDPELMYFYGIALVQIDLAKDARSVFVRMIDQSPRDAQILFNAAQGFVMLGDFEKAVAEFEAAAAIDPRMLKTHYNAGQSYIRLNRMADAEKEFRKELEIDSSDVTTKYHLAFTLLEQKTDADEAVALLKAAIASKPDYADAHYQLGKFYVENGDIAQGIQHLEAAEASDTNKDYIHYQLSVAYRKASRAADAERELKTYSELKAASRSAGPSGIKKQNTP